MTPCAAHSGLQTDIKWLQKGVIAGFALLLSAIVYFNQGLQESIIETNDHIADLHLILNSSKSEHSESLYTFSSRLNSIELMCCEEFDEVLK